MGKEIPQQGAFSEANKIHHALVFLQYSAFVTSILSSLSERITVKYQWIGPSLIVLTVILACLIFIFQSLFNEKYREAEDLRRDGFIDFAFQTKMANIGANGYYDSADIPAGYRRLLAQIHQNSFESQMIINKMLPKSGRRNIAFFVLLFLIAVFSLVTSSFFLAGLQILLSVNFLIEFLTLRRMKNDFENIQKKCKDIWEAVENEPNIDDDVKGTAHIIRLLVQYETTLSYASIMLDSKILNTAAWN